MNVKRIFQLAELLLCIFLIFTNRLHLKSFMLPVSCYCKLIVIIQKAKDQGPQCTISKWFQPPQNHPTLECHISVHIGPRKLKKNCRFQNGMALYGNFWTILDQCNMSILEKNHKTSFGLVCSSQGYYQKITNIKHKIT